MIPDDTANLVPHEYLEKLQREQFGSAPPPYAADVGDIMTASLIGNLPVDQQRSLGDVAIGILPSGDVNALAIKVPGGGEVIALNYGLMSFLLGLNKLLMSRAGVFSFEPLMELDVVRQEAKELAKAFRENLEFKRKVIAPRRMMIASSLASAQASFVVGHELGHILLRHLEGTDAIESAHEMEFAADARGTEMVIGGFYQNRDPLFGSGGQATSLAGPDIFFTYLAFAFGSTKDSPTHPSAVTRREHLRTRFWNELPSEAKALANLAEKVFAV